MGLSSIQNIELEIKQLLRNLEELAASNESSELSRQNGIVVRKMEEMRKAIEEAKCDAEGQSSERERTFIAAKSAQAERRLQDFRADLRKILAHRASRTHMIHKSNTDALLGNIQATRNRRPTTVIKEAQSITSSLQRTKVMMAQEVQRVTDVSQVLAEDGLSLHETLQEHTVISGNVKAARKKLNKYQQRQKMDRLIMYISTGFFLCVVLYVIFQRIRIPGLL
mmetsp:Transcript_7607/g.10142  ORF Transcript_7607/g.10142 Transcript_7607/m.10142 type:complete len:224 (-) Transcript_7607:86-757(-)